VHVFRAPTLTSLHDRLTERMAFATRDKLDVCTSVDVQLHNVVAETPSMEWDFDLKRLWLTEGRWSMMARQYIDPEALDTWVEACADRLTGKRRGIATLRTKTVQQRMSGNGMTRRWGSCMLALTYRSSPTPQVTLHSRTTYLGYIGALDLQIAYSAGSMVADRLGHDMEDVKFVWMVDMAQYHGFKSLAFLLGDPTMRARLLDTEGYPSSQYPALKISRSWLTRIEGMDGMHGKDAILYGDMTYNTYRRVRRRYHAEVLGVDHAMQYEGGEGPHRESDGRRYHPLPSVRASALDLSVLRRPEDITEGADLVDGGSYDEDEDI